MQPDTIKFRKLVCCSKVAGTYSPISSEQRNRQQSICARQRWRYRSFLHMLPRPCPCPPDTHVHTHTLPSRGVRGCSSLGVCLQAGLTAGQSQWRHFDVFVVRLCASRPRSLTLSMTDQRAEGIPVSALQPIHHSEFESGLVLV